MKIDFLQIGFQKCGTTYLEHNVYPLHPEIRCRQAAARTRLEHALLERLILPDGLEYDQARLEADLGAACDELFGADTLNGIMFEGFTFLYARHFDRRNVVDRIAATFPAAKVIFFVRSQRTWLPSLYSQYLRSGGMLSLHDFSECVLHDPTLVGHYIDWHPLVDYLFWVLGKQRVLVCLYEDLRRSPQAVADAIFRFLGVEPVAIDPAVVNPSLGAAGALLQRVFNRILHFDLGTPAFSFHRDLYDAAPSPAARRRHAFTYRWYKPAANYLCGLADRLVPVPYRLVLSPEHLAQLDERYGPGNRQLAALLDRDLRALGYPWPAG